jgi:hypothetical protein
MSTGLAKGLPRIPHPPGPRIARGSATHAAVIVTEGIDVGRGIIRISRRCFVSTGRAACVVRLAGAGADTDRQAITRIDGDGPGHLRLVAARRWIARRIGSTPTLPFRRRR